VARLPTGEVTLFFSDMEGSTRLLQQLGDRFPALLEKHNRIIRSALEAHSGAEIGRHGDAFFAAFRGAGAAVEAAAAAARGLAAAGLAVRIGLHTGTPLQTGGDYVGLDVHRVARICGAAHGGQVLLSEATRTSAGADALDLGEYRLRDLSEPLRLFQLVAPGLERDFPPLWLFDRDLPLTDMPLVGRDRELVELRSLLLGTVRLLTLLGPGGVGKTALALARWAATELALPATFVDLAHLDDAERVPEAIAQALGVPDAEALPAQLRERPSLLVLDNLEQVLGVGAYVSELLRTAPALRVIATSREPLRLAAERRYLVEALDPDAAVELFLTRAGWAGMEAVADRESEVLLQLCARLDGLPLSIELAAARVQTLPPRTLLRRLDERLRLLTRGARDAPARHRTLRGTIEWSYDLLDRNERETFAGLAVFTGGCSLETAEAVAAVPLEALESLVEKSLLRRSDSVTGEPRFAFLETIREYAEERLEESGRRPSLERRLDEYLLQLAREAEPELTGPEQRLWLDRLTDEHENLRALLRRAVGNELGVGLELAGTLWRYWEIRSHAAEMRTWLDAALPRAATRSRGRARALLAHGRLLIAAGAFDDAGGSLELAQELFAELGDQAGEAFALAQLGWIAIARGDYDRAEELCGRALALGRESGDLWIVMGTLNNFAGALIEQGDIGRARGLLDESLSLARRLGDTRNIANQLANVAWAALVDGKPQGVRQLLEETLERAREIDDIFTTPMVLQLLGMEANFASEHERAELLLRQSLELAAEFGERHLLGGALTELAIAMAEREPERAAQLVGAAEAAYADLGMAVPPRDAERLEQAMSAVSVRLSPARFEQARAAGRGLGIEAAAAGPLPLRPEALCRHMDVGVQPEVP
jgi:predicted ATPase